MHYRNMITISSFLWQILLFYLTFLFASTDPTLANSAIAASYAQHCSSIAPEYLPTKILSGASKSFLISEGFFSAGNHINNLLFPGSSTKNTSIPEFRSSSIFHFQPSQVHRTSDNDTLQLEATLELLVRSQVPRRIVFKLSGFWSEAKGKLCMVGPGEIYSSQDGLVSSKLSVVLKLEYPKVSTIKTSIIKGFIESLNQDTSPTYFEPISLLAYTQMRYEYTMIDQAEQSCSHLPQEESVEWDSTSICFNLENTIRYERFTSSGLVDFLGFRFLLINQFACSDGGKVHLTMMLSNETTSPWDDKSILTKLLVAEGVWDNRNNRLCLLICGLIGKLDNSSSYRDCYLGLTLWFPTSFSLKQHSTIMGRMWNMSTRSRNIANTIISLYNINGYKGIAVSGLTYKYTELNKARKYCKIKNFNPKITERYSDAQSCMDMRFQLLPSGRNGKSTWGNAKRIAIGEAYHGNQYGGAFNEKRIYTSEGTTISSSSSLNNQNQIVWNVGYEISYTFEYKNISDSVDINAEGIYNSTTGMLCLIGYRRPSFNRHTINGDIPISSTIIDDRNLDCTFFIQVQLPSINSKNKEGTGTIQSTRANSDPLYFEPIKVKFYLIDIGYSKQEYNRMDVEVIMVIISLTFLCICSYLQLRHVRKYSTIQPLMSITMIMVLILGCIVSLILNTEAIFDPASKNFVFIQSDGWIYTINPIARLITLVTLLIDYRLLQLAWGSRSKKEHNQFISCNAERKSLMFCAPLYIVGVLVAWFANSHNTKYHPRLFHDLERYVGLVGDNFLLPQIIFNMFSQSKEKVLHPVFYVGSTLVRVVPHIYNAYRAWWHISAVNFYNKSHIYANPNEDYYSTLPDIIVPLGGLLFMLLVFLQQRFGSRCFLPKRFRQSDASYGVVYVSE